MCDNCNDTSVVQVNPSPELIDPLKAYLITIAAKTAWADDKAFNVDDYAGGNFDDAYFGGRGDGEVEFARKLLNLFFKYK